MSETYGDASLTDTSPPDGGQALATLSAPQGPPAELGRLSPPDGGQPNDLTTLLQRATAPPSPELTSQFVDLKNRERDAYSQQQAQNDRVNSEDRSRMVSAFNAEQASINDTPKWDADAQKKKYETNPIESFGSFASVFAMVASAFTRAPMENALNGAAAAMTAIRDGNEREYTRAFDAWKANTDLAVKRFNMQHTAFSDAANIMTRDATRGQQKLLEVLTKFGMEKELALYNAGYIPEIMKSQESQVKAIENITRLSIDMKRLDDQLKRTQIMEQRAKTLTGEEAAVVEQLATKYQAEDGLDEPSARLKALQQVQSARSLSREQAGIVTSLRTAVEQDLGRPLNPDEEALVARTATAKGSEAPRMQGAVRATIQQIEDKRKAGEAVDPTKQLEILNRNMQKQGVQRPIDQAILNELEHYPDLDKTVLGNIPLQRQTKLIGAISESPKNLEAIAKFAKEHPESLGLIADAERRMNFDTYQGLINRGGSDAQARAAFERDMDKEVDRSARDKKLDLTQAAAAKVLAKLLTTQAFVDAASSGARGATVYLDRAFREIYQQSSSPEAFFTILEKRYDEADRIAGEYKMWFDNRNDLEQRPFWQQKAAGAVKEIRDKAADMRRQNDPQYVFEKGRDGKLYRMKRGSDRYDPKNWFPIEATPVE